MEENDPKELHRRFLAGELSGQELETYIQQLAEGKFDDSFPDFEQVASQYPYPVKQETVTQRPKTRGVLWRSIAATAALILLLGGYQLWLKRDMDSQQIVYKTIRVDMGKKTEIILTDGTSVTLSPGTVFSYPESFADTLREVHVVTGKAFFNVSRDTLRPFKVHAGKLETIVLGTSFTVENYKEQGFEKINLYTGKIKIRNTNTNTELALTPGQLFEWDDQTAIGRLSEFDTEANPAKAESLSFAQASLKSVLYRIAYLKGIKITLEGNGLANYYISGTFDGMPIDQILQSMELVHKLKINKIDNKTYTIMKK